MPSSRRLAALVLLAVPVIASAEAFTTARDIHLPVTFSKTTPVIVQLDAQTGLDLQNGGRIINSRAIAVPYNRLDDQENLMPAMVFDSVPGAADTFPRTGIEMLRDSNSGTAFQPETAQTLQIQFHSATDIYPKMLVYHLESGYVSNVHVRSGMSASTLHDAYVGVPSGNNIDLAGERARVFEVTITVSQGVLKMSEMELLQPRTRLLFNGTKNEQYRLLYGAYGENPRDYTLSEADATTATLGPVRKPRADERNDHDGVDATDNCPLVWNKDQTDIDKDGVGDSCDNCGSFANTDQLDANGNGQGDSCEDNDKDGVINGIDNCPQVKNSGQQNEDKDTVGDACDNVDSRFSADKPWLLWGSMALIVLALTGAGAMVLRRTSA